MDASADREYRYRWPGVWMVLALVVVVALGLGVPWGRPLWAVLGALFVLMWGAYVGIGVHAAWLARRGRVRLDDTTLRVADGHGRESAMAWGEIEELAVPRKLSGNRTPWVPIEVRGAGQQLAISGFVEDADALIEAIAARAGLTERARTPGGTVYTRPAA